MKLTGNTRYRSTAIRGRLVLQVEVRTFVFGSGWKLKWIDAKTEHLTGVSTSVASSTPENSSLTGRTRFRRTAILNRLVLQVETARRNHGGWPDGSVPPGSEWIHEWRDARVQDLALLGDPEPTLNRRRGVV